MEEKMTAAVALLEIMLYALSIVDRKVLDFD